jgi:hypothetical protein
MPNHPVDKLPKQSLYWLGRLLERLLDRNHHYALSVEWGFSLSHTVRRILISLAHPIVLLPEPVDKQRSCMPTEIENG